ncbi:tripartite motif-containing protein 3-like [Mytilus californianus]|uniref:tripartite motif-containing protein 3-like n=1 Tax=Mytilus californianus TaxID=6549 RepID=UPI002246B627|nr:tripartite motif-containing protein 3-like [Mytilus californianus]XP_052058532.1 tripartite motif-containing protein 3-like [Mytilus californianus]XP_052058533.1 tripartite motif-containing protein 3-like [Mytilus californianus]
MASSSSCKDVCTLCKDDDVSSQALTWCTECEVFLCMDCDNHHKKSRSSKYHTTMHTEDYHKLPAFMQKISSQCKEHNKKFELFCTFHACPCCVQCVTKHHKCQDMKPLSDILTNVKASVSVQLLEKDLKVLTENLDESVKYLKSRINENNLQKTKAIEKIRTMRKSIDDFLNRLEQQTFDDLESNHSKLESNINTLLKQIEDRSVKIHKLQDEYFKMTQYATELQMYFGLTEMEKITSIATTYIENVESGDYLKENNLEIKISSALQSILQDVKSFGDINITSSPSTVQIKAGRKDQAQQLVHTVPEVNQIKPSLLKTVTMPGKIGSVTIYACRILHDGSFLIIDHKKDRLLLFNNEGILMRTVVTFEVNPYDLCIVRNNTVAISLGTLKQAVLVDIENNKIIKRIELSHNCGGVTSDGQILFVISALDDKCTIVNLTDMSHKIIGVGGSFISLFKEKIYCTNSREDKVSCFKTTGEPLWTFMHKDIKYPNGIALDIYGFVYVASFRSNKIVAVSPDGKTSKTILSEADGIVGPIGIDIKRDTGMIIVSSRISSKRQNIFVFKI